MHKNQSKKAEFVTPPYIKSERNRLSLPLSMAKLKVAGTWAGVLEVEPENWTVLMLREEIAKRSNMGTESINLIFAGKVLKDFTSEEKNSLSHLGIKNNSKILACRVSVEEGKTLKNELLADDERNRRLARIKAAVTALSKRHADGALPIEDFDIELEDQSNNDGSDASYKWKAVYQKANEAFSLCNPKSIELVDNIPILQIDMVWCYFMLQDIAQLSVAGLRLEKAREGLERAHGKDSSRFRLLQAGRSSELALYLRLELLEGVVAYHSGQFDKSRKFLTSAQAKFFQLQVPDEALSIVMSMGFGTGDAKRSLRMSNQDVQSAVNLLVLEREQRKQKREDDIHRRNEIKQVEQKRYGVTPLKKAVDLQKLMELDSIGFEKELAAEALRKNENDTQKALDDLTNPDANNALQRAIESRKRKRQQRANDGTVEQLVSMGFERSIVISAVQAGGSLEQVMHQLLTHPRADPIAAADNSSNAHDSLLTNEGPSATEIEQRDLEMEDEIADELARGDAISDYNIDVTQEGEAINEYLALLDSGGGNGKASSSQITCFTFDFFSFDISFSGLRRLSIALLSHFLIIIVLFVFAVFLCSICCIFVLHFVCSGCGLLILTHKLLLQRLPFTICHPTFKGNNDGSDASYKWKAVYQKANEAFSLCNPKSIELVDNIPILQIDMVWCYFMLQDIAQLSVAGLRLEKAREGLERAHGKDSSPFRLLQAGRSSELALYLRLELLEGVVAYHSGQFDKSRKFLTSAQAKFFQLQVPDEALSIVMWHVIWEQDAKRSLRMSNQDVQSAVNLLVLEREQRKQKREDDIHRRNEIKQGAETVWSYTLKESCGSPETDGVGLHRFEKELAAEALRKNENDTQKALDDLTNPDANNALQRAIESRKRKRQQRANDGTVEQLVSMGFERSIVISAVQAGGSLEQVMHQLLTHPRADPIAAADNSSNAHDSSANDNASTPGSTPADAVLENLSPDTVALIIPQKSNSETWRWRMKLLITRKSDAISDYNIDVTQEVSHK
uniref:UBA domain-containing protein n=1 Tax=Salix viminalis TaxID=40686 RepID=A0A6N2K0Y1_SALVM